MWIRETEQTTRYRFWFDVREPGVPAYAGQLGAEAVYLIFIVCGGSVVNRWGWEWLPVLALGIMTLCGGIRRLELWAAALLGVAILGPLAPLLYWGLRVNEFYFFAGVFLLLSVYCTGLPMAIWATWVHRGLRQ